MQVEKCGLLGLLVYLLVVAPATTVGQSRAPSPSLGRWRILRTANDLSGARDARLILRSLEWAPQPTKPTRDKRHGSTLVLACGDRILNTNGRSLLFFPGEAFAMFGDYPQAYVDYRFSAGSQWQHLDPFAYDYRDIFLYENDWRSDEWVTFITDTRNAYFSDAFFARLRAADTLFVRYSGSRDKTVVTFVLEGLNEALHEVPECGLNGQ